MKIQKPTVLDAARLASELKRFIGATIEHGQADNMESRLLIALRNPDWSLVYNVEKRYACMGLAQSRLDMEKTIRAFTGSLITGARQRGNDRIIELDLEREDRLGRKQTGRLVFEIIPNKGDVLLVDDSDSIKWSLKKRDGRYHPPPALKKATALNFEVAAISSGLERPDQIADEIYGLNERDLQNLELGNYSSVEAALEAVRKYVTAAIEPGPTWIIFNGNEAIGYSLLSPALKAEETAREYDSALEMYEAYYQLAAGQSSGLDRLESLTKNLDKEIGRERAKISAIQKELENAEAAGTFRKYGELILTNIDKVKRGAKVIRLEDLESGQEIDIKLDPAKSAAVNAEEYFKRAKKAASSFNVLTARLSGAQKKLVQLETARDNSGGDVIKLEENMIKLGLITRSSGPAKKKTVERRLPYKRFRTSSGWEIWVGRTNTDNDELTFKIARKDDYWFHAWQAAGSHTVLRLPERTAVPDKQTLLEAASLAAHFSKARGSSKVPVAYTQVKFVHKPRNFPPGKVLVDKEKQLIVKPADPERYLIKDE